MTLLNNQFFRFLLVGGFAACVNFLSRIILNEYMSFSQAIVLAYLLGMITAFVLSKLLVFTNDTHSTTTSAFYFVLVNLFAVLQTWAISIGLADYVFPQIQVHQYRQEIAHFIGVIAPVFTSFIGHKYLSFKKADNSTI